MTTLPRVEGWHGARLRAAVDRLHAAQLAAIALQGQPAARAAPPLAPLVRPEGDPAVRAASAFAPPAPPAGDPAARRDAHGAQHEALAQVGEIGWLLSRLGRLEPWDVSAVEIRRRLVTLAVGCAITLAELVSLAFELQGPGPGGAGAGARGRGSGGPPPGP